MMQYAETNLAQADLITDPLPRTKVAYAAILAPFEWDNYKLWHLMYQDAAFDIKGLTLAAEVAGLKYKAPETDIFFPNFGELVSNIKIFCREPLLIIKIFEQCALFPNCDLSDLYPSSNTTVKAILDPTKFNNQHFWHQCIHLFPDSRNIISKSAEEARFDETTFLFDDKAQINYECIYPNLNDFATRLKINAPDYLESIYNGIIECALSEDAKNEAKSIFEPLLEKSHTIKNDFDNGNQKVPYSPVIKFVFKDKNAVLQENQSYYLKLQILSGFLAVAGGLAVILAFTALNAVTLGTAGVIVAGLGAASVLAGFGLFKYATDSKLLPHNLSNSSSMTP